MRIIYIFLLLFTINIMAFEFVKLGDNINVNTCSVYPVSKSYFWTFKSRPSNSNLDYGQISIDNIKNCFMTFKPDVIGLYIIDLEVDAKNILFEYQVLESLEKSMVNIGFLKDNKFYNGELYYYKYYDDNDLIFDIDAKLINDESSGKKRCDKSVSDIQTLDINISDFQNKKVIGITTVYYDDKEVSKFTTENLFSENARAILFSPIKYINNYPSVLYEGNLQNVVDLQYDDIKFYDFNINLEGRGIFIGDSTSIKIKSLYLDKCLVNSLNSTCKYERTINTKISKKISLASGEYEITIYKKKYKKLIKNIIINNNFDLAIENLQKEETVNIKLPENIKLISFTNMNNQNFFFSIGEEDENISIPKGVYNITIFAYGGLYNIKLISINDDLTIDYNWSKINISIKENNKTVYGGIIIIDNKNYIYNNGKIHSFYIKKE